MKTDVISVSSRGARMESALLQADKVAAYKGLSAKSALHLRLLAEEAMGLMRSITGETEGLFWIEDRDDEYELHLQVKTTLSEEGTTVTVKEVLTAGSYSGSKKIPVYVNGTANYITAIANNGTYSTLTLESSVSVANGTAGNIICGRGGGKDGSAVFCTLFLGENAYGVTDVEGGGLEHIVKQRGYGNDPLNQRSSVGWKATKVAKRLVEEYMIRVESGSEFSGTAESN